MPAYGPCGLGAGDACHLVVDHHRPRKTGPCFPLAVLRCTTHGRAFTLYPPGHVPYGRRAIAPVAADGSLVRADDLDEARPRGAGHEVEPDEQVVSPEALAFSGTVFDAALDAACGRIWQRDHLPGGTDRWWSTQGRWIERALLLLGLARTSGLRPPLDSEEVMRLQEDKHCSIDAARADLGYAPMEFREGLAQGAAAGRAAR